MKGLTAVSNLDSSSIGLISSPVLGTAFEMFDISFADLRASLALEDWQF